MKKSGQKAMVRWGRAKIREETRRRIARTDRDEMRTENSERALRKRLPMTTSELWQRRPFCVGRV